jgi:hypothetical protein
MPAREKTNEMVVFLFGFVRDDDIDLSEALLDD